MDNDMMAMIGQVLLEECPWLVARTFDPNDSLRGTLGLDSLALVNVLVSLEDRFDVRFDPDAVDLAQAFSTVGSLAASLAALRAS